MASDDILDALRLMAAFTSECIFFEKGEEAHVFDIDQFFGDWIVVAKRGHVGRWNSFKGWWE